MKDQDSKDLIEKDKSPVRQRKKSLVGNPLTESIGSSAPGSMYNPDLLTSKDRVRKFSEAAQ